MPAHIDSADQSPLRRSSLGWLVAQLGPHVVRLDGASPGLDVIVGDLLIHDAEAPAPVEPGDLVLAVGVVPHSPEANKLVRWAGHGAASAVAFKSDAGPSPDLLAAAAETGVALLALPLEMTWDHFYVLVRRILTATADVADDDDVPTRGDVFSLANVIATMVGGPVKISDAHHQLIAYSNLGDPIDDARKEAILTRREDEEVLRRLRAEGVLGQLLRSREPVWLPEWAGAKPRMAIGIHCGEEVLGFIFVAEGEAPFNETTRSSLQKASSMAALHLLSLRSSDVIERRMRRDLLRGVLEGSGSSALLASRLGVEASGAFTVIGFEVQPSGTGTDRARESGLDDHDDDRLWRTRLRDLALMHAQPLRRRAEAAIIGRTVYVLLPGADQLSAERLTQFAKDVLDSARRTLHLELRGGIASRVDSLGGTPRARGEADQVLRLLRTRVTDRKVATFDQLRAHAFLLNLQETSSLRSLLESSKVAALHRLDARQGTTYVQTLTAYFDAFGDLNAAAERIHIHRNTLRYRLRKLCELVALDLTDPTERLVCHLELRLLEGEFPQLPAEGGAAVCGPDDGPPVEDRLLADVGGTSHSGPRTARSS